MPTSKYGHCLYIVSTVTLLRSLSLYPFSCYVHCLYIVFLLRSLSWHRFLTAFIVSIPFYYYVHCLYTVLLLRSLSLYRFLSLPVTFVIIPPHCLSLIRSLPLYRLVVVHPSSVNEAEVRSQLTTHYLPYTTWLYSTSFAFVKHLSFG